MKLFISTIIAAFAAIWVQSAHASLTYEFHKTSTTPADLPISIRFTIENGTGVKASYSHGPNSHSGSLDGLLDLQINVAGLDVFEAGWPLEFIWMCPDSVEDEYSPQVYCRWLGIDIELNPNKFDIFVTTPNDLYFQVANTGVGPRSVSGEFWTDIPNAWCGDVSDRGCFFDGEFRRVPEPASYALLLAALGFLGFVRKATAHRI